VQSVNSVLRSYHLCRAVKIVWLTKDYTSSNIVIFLYTCKESSKNVKCNILYWYDTNIPCPLNCFKFLNLSRTSWIWYAAACI
jgi:hypothetical protein